MNSSTLHTLLKEKLLEISSTSDWQMSGPKIQSRECSIFQAHSNQAQKTLAVKCYAHQTGKTAAKQQFNALINCYEGLLEQNEGFCAPKPYYYDMDHRVLVMDWVPGNSLHSYLWKPWTYPTSIQTLLAKTGMWLRTFHNTTLSKPEEIGTSNLLKGVNRLLKNTREESHNDISRDPIFQSSLLLLQQFCSKHLSIRGFQSLPHGDFTPANLLLAEKKTFALDIWGNSPRPINMDMARMVVYLSIAYPLFNHHAIFDNQGNITPKFESLFSSYGTDILNPIAIDFKIALLAEYLRRWLVISNRIFTYKGIVTDRYQILQIKKQVSRLANCVAV